MILLLALIYSFQVQANDLPIAGLEKVPSAQIMKGKSKALAYFWATWCVTCKDKLKKDIPELIKVSKSNVFTVSVDRNAKRIEHYLKKRKINVPVFYEKDGSLMKKMNIQAVPYWIVYEKDHSGNWVILDQDKAFDRKRIEKILY